MCHPPTFVPHSGEFIKRKRRWSRTVQMSLAVKEGKEERLSMRFIECEGRTGREATPVGHTLNCSKSPLKLLFYLYISIFQARPVIVYLRHVKYISCYQYNRHLHFSSCRHIASANANAPPWSRLFPSGTQKYIWSLQLMASKERRRRKRKSDLYINRTKRDAKLSFKLRPKSWSSCSGSGSGVHSGAISWQRW